MAADAITYELAYAIETVIDRVAFNGTGVSADGGMTGVLTAIVDGSHAAGAVVAGVNNDTLAEFTVADFASVIAALPSYAHSAAQWICSPQVWALVMCRLSATAGGPLSLGGQPSFMGYPVTLTPAMPTGTGATDYTGLPVALFGDASMAGMFGERRSIRVAKSDSPYFEYDVVEFRASTRMDCVWHNLGDGSTAGAVVALIGA
jgi:HK97 family phage major capsid protein